MRHKRTPKDVCGEAKGKGVLGARETRGGRRTHINVRNAGTYSSASIDTSLDGYI